jgi:thymidine kinase
MKYIPRRKGKSVLPKLLKEFGFDKEKNKGQEITCIVFDEAENFDESIFKDLKPIIKEFECAVLFPPISKLNELVQKELRALNEAVPTESKEEPDKVK